MIHCPNCGKTDFSKIRNVSGGRRVKHVYFCRICGKEFTTIELNDWDLELMRTKCKLLADIKRSCTSILKTCGKDSAVIADNKDPLYDD